MPNKDNFNGEVGLTIDESEPDWPAPTRAPDDAPNVIFITLDDVGYAQLGCYGGLIDTPNIDRLAESGLQYTDFHTTALCSPTRSCILTGRNHHSNSMGNIPETSTGYPSYTSQIPSENGLISENLVEQGYSTFALGKWHLTPDQEMNMAASKEQWPLGRGFERYYGFLGAETNQYEPNLIYDNHPVQQPNSLQEGYHLTEDITDRAIEFITDVKNIAPEKPFFMYYCPGATHAPHHVQEEWIEKYEGEFDMGWDEARKHIFEQQKERGIIPENTKLPPRDPDVPEWDTLTEDEQHLYARMMEVFAGYLEHTDQQIGRLLDHLERLGNLDNTFIALVSDNGASAEGGETGTVNEHLFFNMIPESLENNLEAIDELGGPNTYNHYPWGWAWAGNTPMRRWKRESYRGGTSDPLIIHWPDGIDASGELRTQYTHAIDLVPTVLDATNLESLDEIKGVAQSPIEGTSFRHSFENSDVSSGHLTQYYEMFGHRSIYHDGWKAVCPWPAKSFAEAEEEGREFSDPITAEDLENLRESWQLFHVAEDFAESDDVADKHPDKLQELINRWWKEAGKYDVLPLDGRLQQRFNEPRPQIGKSRDQHIYYPGGSSISEAAAIDVKNRSHTIAAEVNIPEKGAEGVLLAHGGRFGGYSFYVQDDHLHYVHNFVGRKRYSVSSTTEITPGQHALAMEFEQKQEPNKAKNDPGRGIVRLLINGEEVGEGSIERTTPIRYSINGDDLCCGFDNRTPVSTSYETPFQFTGDLKRVIVDTSGDPYIDLELEEQLAMTRQ